MFYFFDNTKIYNFIILIFNIFKIKYFSLDELNLSKYKLTKPNSLQLKRDNPESIILAKNYFLNMKNINLEKKSYIVHYFLKNLEFGDFNLKNQYNFNDFVSFLRVNNINFNSNKVQIISVYKNIITNKYINFYFSFIKNLIVFFIINVYLLKVISILSLSLFFKKYEIPKILYLRKKNYPDPLWNEINNLYDNDSKKINNSLLIFKIPKNNDKFLPLNMYKNSLYNFTISFFKTYKELFSMFIYFRIQSLPIKLLVKFHIENFNTNYINLLNPKVILGVFTDKSFYILLYKNKIKSTFMSLNESFHYPPIKNFDYVYTDIYFCMNDIEKKFLNKNGGEIKKYVTIPFYRSYNKINNEHLISKELLNLYKNFDKTILCASINTKTKNPSNLSMWSLNDLNNYVNSIYSISKKNKDILFIIKEKKNELSELNTDLYKNILKRKNIFVVRTQEPKKQYINNFDSLLNISEMLISMSYRSTTIWECLSQDKPFIAINDFDERSFLHEYNFETTTNELENIFNSYLINDKKELSDKLKKFKKLINVQNVNGLIYVKRFIDENY